MATTAATAALSCNLSRPFSVDRSALSASRSLRCAPLRRTAPRRISAIPQKPITPQVQAKKQTFSSLDELLEKSDKPVLVDFYATWCGPCQIMVPILEQVSDRLKDKIQVVKVDTEKYPTIAGRYRVEALPTFILFRDGKPCDRFEGALPADQLVQRIEDALKVPQ